MMNSHPVKISLTISSLLRLFTPSRKPWSSNVPLLEIQSIYQLKDTKSLDYPEGLA
jgi:hypothetical protein